jgi:hypothetical protein
MTIPIDPRVYSLREAVDRGLVPATYGANLAKITTRRFRQIASEWGTSDLGPGLRNLVQRQPYFAIHKYGNFTLYNRYFVDNWAKRYLTDPILDALKRSKDDKAMLFLMEKLETARIGYILRKYAEPQRGYTVSYVIRRMRADSEYRRDMNELISQEFEKPPVLPTLSDWDSRDPSDAREDQIRMAFLKPPENIVIMSDEELRAARQNLWTHQVRKYRQ